MVEVCSLVVNQSKVHYEVLFVQDQPSVGDVHKALVEPIPLSVGVFLDEQAVYLAKAKEETFTKAIAVVLNAVMENVSFPDTAHAKVTVELSIAYPFLVAVEVVYTPLDSLVLENLDDLFVDVANLLINAVLLTILALAFVHLMVENPIQIKVKAYKAEHKVDRFLSTTVVEIVAEAIVLFVVSVAKIV